MKLLLLPVRPNGITGEDSGDMIGTSGCIDIRRGDAIGEDMGVSTAPSAERTPEPVRLMNAGTLLPMDGTMMLSGSLRLNLSPWGSVLVMLVPSSVFEEVRDRVSSWIVVSVRGCRSQGLGDSARPVIICRIR